MSFLTALVSGGRDEPDYTSPYAKPASSYGWGPTGDVVKGSGRRDSNQIKTGPGVAFDPGNSMSLPQTPADYAALLAGGGRVYVPGKGYVQVKRSLGGGSSGSRGNMISNLISADITGQRTARDKAEADRQSLLGSLSNTNTPGVTGATADVYSKAEGVLNDMLTGGALGDDYWKALESRNVESINASTRSAADQLARSRQPGWQEARQRVAAGRQGDVATALRDVGIAKAESTQGQQKAAGDLATSLLNIKGAQTAEDARLALSRTDLMRSILGQYPYQATDYSPYYSAIGTLDPQALLAGLTGASSNSGRPARGLPDRNALLASNRTTQRRGTALRPSLRKTLSA